MEGKNPREGCAALVLKHYHQRRAGVARIGQTWLPTRTIRQPGKSAQRARVPGQAVARRSASHLSAGIVARLPQVRDRGGAPIDDWCVAAVLHFADRWRHDAVAGICQIARASSVNAAATRSGCALSVATS